MKKDRYWFTNIIINLLAFLKNLLTFNFKKMEDTKNRGVLIPQIPDTDYIVGVNSKIPYQVICSDWSLYLPSHENQFSNRADFMDCVTESFNNSIETQMNRMIKTGQFSQDQLEEMNKLGYFDENGLPNFSDRFLAKMSGTTKEGNTQNKVAETARKFGLIGEKDWGETENMTWEEYYEEIPQNIIDKAKKIFNFINIGNREDGNGNTIEPTGGYEWVVTSNNPVGDHININKIFEREVLHAPIQTTIPICPSYSKRSSNNVLSTCPLVMPQHAVLLSDMINKSIRKIFDSYPPYIFSTNPDYPIPFGLKIVAKAVKLGTKTTPTEITKEEKISLFKRFYKWFTGKDFIGW